MIFLWVSQIWNKLAKINEWIAHSEHAFHQQLASMIHCRFIFAFRVCRGFVAESESYFFRLIEFLNVVLCCWFQLHLLVRLYETEESFHGR